MKNKKILFIGLIIILTSFLYMPKVFGVAASISLKASNNNPTVGDSVTITATAVAGGFNLTLSGNGQTKQIVGQTDKTDNVSKSTSITFTPTEAKTYTFKLTGDYTDFYKDDATTVNKEVSVTVKAKAVEQPKTETPATTTEKPTTTETPKTTEEPKQEQPKTVEEPKQEQPKTVEEPKKQEEPNFTDTNKTMYASKGINLRSSWSTSSSATYIEKGTELNITATSTNTVNGYVWYRVSYNGQTKYVASYLLTSTKPEEEKKSNNCNLKSLSVGANELIPAFSSNVTSYTVQVAKDTKKLEIKAEPEDAKATVSIKGNEQLKEEGESLATVSVSAEDGTTKIYEIKVEKIAEEKQALGLQSLKIIGSNIDSKFKTSTYNYEINIEPEVTDLKIDAIANDETATVEILGNENLQEGENIITIIVSSKDGTEKVTYQIKANKKAKTVETVAETVTVKTDNSKMLIYMGVGVIILIALIIVVVYTIKHRNKDYYEEEQLERPDELPEKKIEKNNEQSELRKKGKHF